MSTESSTTDAKRKILDSQLSAFLAKAGLKDRTTVEKHFAACEADPDPRHATLFRRLFSKMSSLAPSPLRATSSFTAQFYIPDGAKYRKQVFALEDHRDGIVVAYFPDILADAVKEKLLIHNRQGFSTSDAPDDVLAIEQMDEKNPLNPPEHVKHLTGWNRKAVKLTVKVSPTQGSQAELVEQLCDLAAQTWTK